jgi:hypothetical protein
VDKSRKSAIYNKTIKEGVGLLEASMKLFLFITLSFARWRKSHEGASLPRQVEEIIAAADTQHGTVWLPPSHKYVYVKAA